MKVSGDETAAQRLIDFDMLREHALRAAGSAYRPYSGLGVGAAAIATAPQREAAGTASSAAHSTSARIVTGCNVENASYGLTLCAECSLVSDLHRTGGGRLLEVVVVAHSGEPLAPCGRCRQLLHEHGGPDLIVHGARGPVRLGALLPDAFGPEDLT